MIKFTGSSSETTDSAALLKVLIPLTKDQIIRVKSCTLPTEAIVNLACSHLSFLCHLVEPTYEPEHPSFRRCTSNFTKLHSVKKYLVASAHCAWISSCWETEKCSGTFKSGSIHKDFMQCVTRSGYSQPPTKRTPWPVSWEKDNTDAKMDSLLLSQSVFTGCHVIFTFEWYKYIWHKRIFLCFRSDLSRASFRDHGNCSCRDVKSSRLNIFTCMN